MNLQIESPQTERDDKLEKMIRDKFEHFGKKYERITSCTVLFHKQKDDVQKRFFMEAKMEMPRKILFASNKAQSYEIALAKIIQELDHQLGRYKEELLEQR
jgi:ribosomal subunit interface protein